MNELDHALVRRLQQDGRASFSDLAKSIGGNRTLVAGRVNQLLSSGDVRVVAAVHPRVLGLVILAHLALRITGDGAVVLERLDALDSAVYVSETTGPYQLVVEVRLRTMGELYETIAAIRAEAAVVDVNVLVYERVIRSLFLGEEPALDGLSLDETDIEIMKILQRDGRTGFADIAAAVGLSVSACRTRVLRLIESNIMRVGAIARRGDTSATVVFGCGLTIGGDTAEVLAWLGRHEGVEFVARTVGRYSLVATFAVDSQRTYNQIVHELRALESVLLLDTWLHTNIIRERYENPLDRLVAGTG